MRRFALLLIIILTAVSCTLRAQGMPVAHPRLLLPAGEEPRIVSGSLLARPDSVITAFSDASLAQPPVERVMVGKRLLHTSREALKRIFYLSWTYRVHGGEKYARRAIDEMLAVSAFSDWNPSHFLDVGEMTMAVAIGYDWLYDAMTPVERETVARAVIEKGLRAALNESDAWFYTSEINWNAVCNAGMVYGALAVWEEDPDFCSAMLEKSVESNRLSYKAYAAGGYPEGYNYWGYGTSFQIMLEAAMATAFPGIEYPDRPLPEGYEGFLASADFVRFMSTPSGNCFSFSDCGRPAVGQYMQAWMAGRRGDLSLLAPEIGIMEDTGYSRLCEERLFPMYLICLSSLKSRASSVEYPEDHYFTCGGTTPVFVYRGGWRSRDDDYLGVKGGMTMSSHSHCDQGSFYFESDGVAWATDLGMQDYNSLESSGVDLWDMTQDSERWQVFRIGPFSHNILTVDGQVPRVNRAASFSQRWMPEQPSAENRAGASLDLTELYQPALDSCKRTVYLQGSDLHVIDVIQADDSLRTVRWAMCSEAEHVTCLGQDAVFELRSGSHVRVLEAVITEGGHPLPAAHEWPVTYDASASDTDGMQYLHPTDMPNPDAHLIGYTVELQPHQKVTLHVCLRKVN